MAGRRASAALTVRDLHVYYGASHALQGVDITVGAGCHAVVGRNGMGKTTLCNTIMGLTPARSGSIRFEGRELTGRSPNEIAGLGVGYTPQGRRLWPSLTVDEHLRLCQRKGGSWDVDRVYAQFPRLAERRSNGGAQLSGGEQQMLAISRALLADPRLLVLDEPTEGLAPVIVDQVIALLQRLASEGEVAILLVEQNIAVATEVADDVAIMSNGRITTVLPAAELGADRALQQRLLGVGRVEEGEGESEGEGAAGTVAEAGPRTAGRAPRPPAREVASLPRPAAAGASARFPSSSRFGYTPPARWSRAAWSANGARGGDGAPPSSPASPTAPRARAPAAPIATHDQGGAVLVVGTFDTKAAELGFIRDRLRDAGVPVRTVDLSTSGRPSGADVPPHHVAGAHPRGAGAVFTGDRGTAVKGMTEAFERWMRGAGHVGGVVSAAGSGGTALATPAMRALPVGVPKVMVSTVASGDVSPYVGPSDITMMYSVTDIAGLNRISRRVLANAADAMIGMARGPEAGGEGGKPALGLTMFGVTTTAVNQAVERLPGWECLVFHATGTGGRSMEKLADSALLDAALDLTTTEVADHLVGGVFAADEDRFGAFVRSGIPWVGSLGATDMVNFGARETVPDRFADRLFYEHNPQVTLMRTTPDENRAIARFITARVNRMGGPVRLLIPEGGVSALDAPGQAFDDPAARAALFDTVRETFEETATRRLVSVPHHINDPAFADAAVAALGEVTPRMENARAAV